MAFGLSLLAALPDALLALWFKLLADGVLGHSAGLVIGGGASGSASRRRPPGFCDVISDRMQRRFRDRVTIALESHVARLQASVATIEHHERPEYLDRLAVLRDQVFVLDHMYMSLFSTLRLDPAAGRDGGAAGVDPSGAGAARGVRAADGADLHVAAGRGARGARSAARRPTGWRGTCSTSPRPRRPARRCA